MIQNVDSLRQLVVMEHADRDISLTVRVAEVRVVLALANLAVILLDATPPVPNIVGGFATAELAAIMSIFAATTLLLAVKRTWLPLGFYEHFAPISDVSFAGLLILATGGFQSPFFVLMVFAVVATAVSRRAYLPLFASALAALANITIALMPGHEPDDIAIFIVRTTYVFAFAAVIASIVWYLRNHYQQLQVLEEFGLHASASSDRADVLAAFSRACKTLNVDEEVALEEAMNQQLGTSRQRLRQPQARYYLLLIDRLRNALRRLELTKQLSEAAVLDERARVADELHDTVIQQFASIDMQSQAALTREKELPDEAAATLQNVGQAAKAGIQSVRNFLQSSEPTSMDHSGLWKLAQERWPGELSVKADDTLKPTGPAYFALEMFIREGMNNALRHGRANRLDIRLVRTESRFVNCELRADGVAPSTAPNLGYGLRRLKSMAARLEGEVELTRNNNEGGSVLTLRLPEECFHDTSGDR